MQLSLPTKPIETNKHKKTAVKQRSESLNYLLQHADFVKVKGRLPKHRSHRPALEIRLPQLSTLTNATKPGRGSASSPVGRRPAVQGHAVSAIRIFHVFIVKEVELRKASKVALEAWR